MERRADQLVDVWSIGIFSILQYETTLINETNMLFHLSTGKKIAPLNMRVYK